VVGVKGTRQLAPAVKAAEDEIEREFDALPIFSHDRETAAYHVLTAFEDAARFSACVAGEPVRPYALYPTIRRFKVGLEQIVPKIFDRCPMAAGGALHLDETVYCKAADALRFAADYGWFAAMMFHAYNGRASVRAKGDRLIFSAPHGGMDRDVLSELVRDYTTDRLLWRRPLAGITPPVPVEEVERAISRTVKARGSERIEYSPALPVVAFADQVANWSVPRPELPDDVGCGGYTLAQFLAVWTCLFRLALVHHLYCLYSGIPGHARASVVIQTSLPELGHALQVPRLVPEPCVARILSDVVYDNSKPLRDVQIQPLVPVSGARLLIAPQLILTFNWEQCLLRIWSKRYGDEYGKQVASRKGALAAKWEELFKGRGFLTASRRVLRDASGRPVTDVDVAVFDRPSNFLALFEVKWLIDVETAREIRDADEELEHGLEQLDTAERFARTSPAEFFSQVFSEPDMAIAGELRVFKALVGLGHVGSHVGPLRRAVILAYPVARDFMQSTADVSLEALCDQLKALMDRSREGEAYRLAFRNVQLGRFSVRLPALEMSGGLS
jgi:hypothetical protein